MPSVIDRYNFYATKSFDFDGSIVAYDWDFKDGSPSSTEAFISHTFQNPGVYAVSLIVTDDLGATDETTLTITVADISNTPPIAIANANMTTGDAPLVVNFDSIGSTDVDGFIISYVWNFRDGSPISTNPNPTHTFDNIGVYNVSLLVTDEYRKLIKSHLLRFTRLN